MNKKSFAFSLMIVCALADTAEGLAGDDRHSRKTQASAFSSPVPVQAMVLLLAA